MSDERDDQPDPVWSNPGGSAEEPAADEPLEITELTPPPASSTEKLPAAEEPAAPAAPAIPVEPAPPPAAPVGGPVLDPVILPTPPAQPTPWPPAAKTTTAILAVLALLAGVAAVIGFTRDTGDDTEGMVPAEELAAAEARADAAEERVGELEALNDEQLGQLDALVAELGTVTAERDTLLVEAAAAASEQERLEAELADAEEQIATLEATIADAAGRFPIAIRTDLEAEGVQGTYSVRLTEVSCLGLDLCGNPPAPPSASIARGGGGELRIVVPGAFDIPLVGIGGSLFGVADDQSLVPPCGDVPRNPTLTMAVFGDAGQLQLDGSLALTDLGASIYIEVPAIGECGPGFVWYSSQLSRTG